MKKKKKKDWSNKMQNRKDGGQNLPSPNKEQRGRSMIEMLGVLAIIGVLSVGGLAGYNTAMRKIQITKALNEMQLVIQDCLQQHLTLKKPSKNQLISSVNLQYFIFDHSGLELTEDNNIPQNSMSPAQFQKTKEEIIKKIGSFKEKYPKGKVILTCHTGLNLGDEIAKESKVDLVFDAHEHKDEIRFVNGTMIVCLSQNFKKIANAKMEIDDNGDTKNITLKELRPNESGFQSGELTAFYKQLFSEDLKKTYGIKSTDSDITSLSIDGIRNKNNYLANFVTDCIMEEIKEIDPEVRIFALNSSASAILIRA